MTRASILVIALLIPSVCGKSQTPQDEIIALDDEYNVKPPVTPVDLRIAQRARQILNLPEKWDPADTRVCRIQACKSGCPSLAKDL